MASFRFVTGGVLFALPLLVTDVPAQIRASERGSVSQTVDGTVITVDYARPRARGRTDLFGGEVKWGEVWTPGANLATTLEVSKDVRINGNPVPRGKYSVWMQVWPDSAWTLILDTTVDRFHTDRPEQPEPAQIRFPVTPTAREPLEVLTWSFPEIRSDGAVLVMDWTDRSVSLNITVPPSRPTTIAADRARPMVGVYRMRHVAGPPPDSAAEGPPPMPPARFEVFFEKGSLWARWDPAPFPGMELLLLVPLTESWFMPVMMQDGAIYDAMDEIVIEFKVEGGKASGFDVRITNDELIATASRE